MCDPNSVSLEAQQFEAHRPLMFSIAYRMLGTVTDAEDMVQQAYLRYRTTPATEIVSHKAFLSTIVTRLCINYLQRAQNQRETYIGPWLPEPVLTEQDNRLTPGERVELHESLSLAFLALLERLTPAERAVFLLREVFDYSYREIAEIIDKEEAACRQLLSRARKHITAQRPRFKPSPQKHRQMLDRFIQAIWRGEFEGLVQLLAEDVVMWADGGGKTRGAFIRPLHGREAVVRFLLASPRLATAPFTTAVEEVNGEPAFILRSEGQTRIVISISVEDDRISSIRAIGNPDKLRGLDQALDARGAAAGDDFKQNHDGEEGDERA